MSQNIHVEKIEKALDTIRPFLEADGGNVELIEVSETGVVKIKFVGACSSCSMSNFTMKNGIEDAIKRAVPEITEILAI
jgi:Fe-S cluster biogenesis protein NfuA